MLAQLVDEQVLRDRLRNVSALRPGIRLTVGIAVRNSEVCLEIAAGEVTIATAAPITPGCLTKLFTGSIAIEAMQRQGLPIDTSVGRYLGTEVAEFDVQLRHLLDHTHGWDTTTADDLLLDSSGYVDAERICQQLSAAGRIATPGKLHCYANANAWLTASLAEKVSGETYGELLMRRLFTNDEINQQSWSLRREPAAHAVCGATGEGMSVSAGALLAFLRSFWCGNRRAETLSVAAGQSILALPGWSGAETGVLRGWKSYGSGWFGHSAARPGAYGLVRVHPVEQVAVFVCSSDQNCSSVATALFGRMLPTFVPVRSPSLLPAGSSIDYEIYAGVYEVAAIRIVIERAEGARLGMRAYQRAGQRVESEPFYVGMLRAATEHVFYTDPVDAELFPYLQFVGPARPFSYLWNGKGLWLRRPGAGTGD
jgi:hypothetical protein